MAPVTPQLAIALGKVAKPIPLFFSSLMLFLDQSSGAVTDHMIAFDALRSG